MPTFWQALLVAVGSAIGGVLRWLVGVAFAKMLGLSFPYGTFFINVTGSLFLGWFGTLLLEHFGEDPIAGLARDDWRLLVAVGFTGGYTTFSSFEYEAFALMREDKINLAFLYLFASVALGLLAVRAGVYLAKG